MIELCVDASVAVKWALKGEPYRNKARTILNSARSKHFDLIAPHFFASEVDTAIRRHVYIGSLTSAQARNASLLLDSAPVTFLDVPGMRQRAREIAEQFNQPTVYDSVYAALAELRGCELWTADEPFYKAVKAALPYVKVLADYP